MRIPRANLGFGYRTSVFKAGQSHPARAGVITAVEFELTDAAGTSEPVAYDQLASALAVPFGSRVPVADVRDRVLALRASKGMVLDPADADTRSCGSFFTNPIVSDRALEGVPADAPRWQSPQEPTAQEPTDVAVPLGEQPAPPPARRPHPHEAQRRVADRARRDPARVPPAGVAGGDLVEAHSGDHEPRGSDGRGGRPARAIRAEPGGREFGVVLHPEPILVGVSL